MISLLSVFLCVPNGDYNAYKVVLVFSRSEAHDLLEFFIRLWLSRLCIFILLILTIIGFNFLYQETSIMAFYNKVGNVLRQSVAHSIKAPVSSMLNCIRCMSSSKLFIGGIHSCWKNSCGYKPRTWSPVFLWFYCFGLCYFRPFIWS